ncbi:sulfite exporter TauE/SafE family protein [Nocardioides pyridinolyticus]
MAVAALAVAAILVGVAKTAISGVGAISVVIFAAVLPARESTGAILPLLICGDLVAVVYYRRHADWAVLGRLLLGVLPGTAFGAWFLAVVDDTLMRQAIALILLVMCGLQLWQRRRVLAVHEFAGRGSPVSLAMGAVAGFATMTANAAGPVTTIYLLMAGLTMLQLIGTGAWFYLVVNVIKLPMSIGLGLITPGTLALDLALVPAMLAGAVLGILLIQRIDQRRFELVALGFGGLAALVLLAT